MAAALAALQERLGRQDATLLLDRFAEEFPGRRPSPSRRPARLEELLLTRVANENPALGAAARAGRRPAAGGGDALPRGHRRARGRRSPTDPARESDGHVRSSSCSATPAPSSRRPRSPASSATSASAGRALLGRASTTSSRRLDLAIGDPRRGGARPPPAVRRRAGGAGGTAEAPVVRRARPTSPRRSRRTRPGCRGSC